MATDYAASTGWHDTIVLQCSDGNQVLVSKTVISVLSPVFKGMFDMAADTGETLKVSEDAQSLGLLVDAATRRGVIATGQWEPCPKTIAGALKAADKYEMEAARDLLLFDLA